MLRAKIARRTVSCLCSPSVPAQQCIESTSHHRKQTIALPIQVLLRRLLTLWEYPNLWNEQLQWGLTRNVSSWPRGKQTNILSRREKRSFKICVKKILNNVWPVRLWIPTPAFQRLSSKTETIGILEPISV
jgi:hypothetical protein